jgi:hypothetical protein
VAQIDEVMIDERERLIMQGRRDRFDDVVHLRRFVIDAGAAEERQARKNSPAPG